MPPEAPEAPTAEVTPVPVEDTSQIEAPVDEASPTVNQPETLLSVAPCLTFVSKGVTCNQVGFRKKTTVIPLELAQREESSRVLRRTKKRCYPTR
jgi:hypothetical protein